MNTETLAPKPNLTQHVQDLRRDAGNVAQDLKNHAQAKLQDVKEQAQTKLQDVKKQANSRFQDAKEETATRFEQAKVTTRDVVDSVRDFVAEHPFAAFGVGVALGIFLGARAKR